MLNQHHNELNVTRQSSAITELTITAAGTFRISPYNLASKVGPWSRDVILNTRSWFYRVNTASDSRPNRIYRSYQTSNHY